MPLIDRIDLTERQIREIIIALSGLDRDCKLDDETRRFREALAKVFEGELWRPYRESVACGRTSVSVNVNVKGRRVEP